MSKFLAEYLSKRSFDRTPEPKGSGAQRPGLFVVQKHSATRLHYDLRLEHEGVLKSFAVPRGPSPDPADKRMAAHTEDHPVEYADFEGVIPAGEYGAGPMIVWDLGRMRWLIPYDEGLRAGKLLFELHGFKLRGAWTLVKTKAEWLLIKETKDVHVRRGGWAYDERSVYSGLLVEELASLPARLASLREELGALNVPRGPLGEVAPMLAETSREPFDDPAFLFEVKYDGFRALVERDGGAARIHYRRGTDSSHVYPDLAHFLRRLPAPRFVADGELAVLDETGRPSFQRLQKRALLTNSRDLERAALELPATLFLFDLLGFDEFDLRGLPLLKRKELLARIVPPLGVVRAVDHVIGHGRALFASVRELGLEGIMAKRAQSTYRSGRWADWQKVRSDQTGDFVVVGFTAGEGKRAGFGALHLAQYRGDELVYLGRVGGGFSDKQLREAASALDELRIPAPPCVGPVPHGRGHVWVQPRLVVEVRYKEITDDGLLRQPTFLRFRTDKKPGECVVSGYVPVQREVTLTNLDKVFWPAAGYTKGDLIAYYKAIGPWILPWLRDRPLVLTRYPNGIEGKSFYQKDAPEHTPGWMRTVHLAGGGGFSREPSLSGNEADFFVCDDLESLLYLANLGTIPLHFWSARAADILHPDWSIIDLDPKAAPFSDVVKLARAVHELCDEIGMPSYCKTSGQKGLHILLPMGGQLDHAQATTFAELIARAIESRHPDISSTERKITDRRGKVYLDFLQNGYGKTIASTFSARPIPAASVSMPLKWSEVNGKLDPSKFTIQNAAARMARLGVDPCVAVLTEKPDLQAALRKLSGLVQ